VRVSLDVSAIPGALTGVGRYVTHLIPELHAYHEVDVRLVARRGDTERWRLGPVVVGRAPRPRPLRLAWEQYGLPRLLDQLGVDVHHAPHYTMPERARAPVVVTIHDMTFFDHPQWHERAKVRVFRRAIAVAARRAAAVVCVSETTAARFRARFADAPPVFVAPHGVDLDRFTAIASDRDATSLAALGVRPPYVAFLGTLEPRKDVGTLIRAFDVVAAQHDDLRLVIAGATGWGDPGIDGAIAAARHADRVQRLGYVALDDVPALLRNAAAVVYPSVDEGFGMPVLEALACGAPVVTSAGTAMEEVAADVALLAPAGDVGAFADAIGTVVGGGAAVDDLRRRGINRAAAYTWAHSAAVHLDAYRSVA
jgi:glycosyltransferase involved in cell wall biosynthesis